MSGGYFDYHQFTINQVVEQLDALVERAGDGSYYADVVEHVSADIAVLRRLLVESSIRLHELDYLVEGDTGLDSYRARLKQELEKIDQ